MDEVSREDIRTNTTKKLSILLNISILNKIFKSKLPKKLGLKECSIAISGAAPLAKDFIDWYATIGIEILQVYGMTEDCCISHFNIKGCNKVGTVGKVLPGVEIKFSADGEIPIKNESLFKGYYKNLETTTEVLREDGYFHTGDLGEYDHEGYLTITGRVKDQFKTDKSKYISTSHIELKFSNNADVDQICIVGNGIPQPIALIVISEKENKNLEKILR
jgi:long-chain acyl-CoA synthetase